jgi:hypothetical protein
MNEIQNYTLLWPTDENSSISTTVDVRSVQRLQETTNTLLPSFPNPAYESFVQLLTKHHLPDSAANDIIRFFNTFYMDPRAILPSNAKSARSLLDAMQIPHILYNKTTIMEYNQIQYTLYHRTIYDTIKELLSNPDIFKHCVFDYIPKYKVNNQGNKERCYGEQYSCEWWNRAQTSISEGAKILSIIFYSDATTCDILGKTSKHPVYLTLGNIPNWRRNKPDAKALLAYLPRMEASNEQKKQQDFFTAKHHLFHHSMDILIKPLKLDSIQGIDLRTDNGILWCYPFLSELLGDLPEHHAITLTFNSANCKMPCYACTTPKDQFNDLSIDNSVVQLRTPKLMQYILQDGLANEYSLHDINNRFWTLP